MSGPAQRKVQAIQPNCRMLRSFFKQTFFNLRAGVVPCQHSPAAPSQFHALNANFSPTTARYFFIQKIQMILSSGIQFHFFSATCGPRALHSLRRFPYSRLNNLNFSFRSDHPKTSDRILAITGGFRSSEHMPTADV